MPDLIGLIGKLFSNEPLERLMYMLIISIAALWFVPDGFVQFFNEKVGIPYAFHILVFAISFVLSINAQRLFGVVRYKIDLFIERRKDQRFIQEINQVIDELSDGQKVILAQSLSQSFPVIHVERSNSDVAELVRLGVLIMQPGQLLPEQNPYAVVKIEEGYWYYLNNRWNGFTGKIS